MHRILVNAHDGSSSVIEAGDGVSVMRAVIDSGTRGLLGDCGGNLSCATCHAYIAEPWLDKISPPSEMEEVMLECALDVGSGSRLTCQIIMNQSLDGLEISLPETQV